MNEGASLRGLIHLAYQLPDVASLLPRGSTVSCGSLTRIDRGELPVNRPPIGIRKPDDVLEDSVGGGSQVDFYCKVEMEGIIQSIPSVFLESAHFHFKISR